MATRTWTTTSAKTTYRVGGHVYELKVKQSSAEGSTLWIWSVHRHDKPKHGKPALWSIETGSGRDEKEAKLKARRCARKDAIGRSDIWPQGLTSVKC